MSRFLIKKESVLNSLSSRGVDERTLIYLDAISHTVSMIEIMFTRLIALLTKHTELIEDKDSRFHDTAMIEAWGIVDCLHRLRQILSSSSGIKKNVPWFQKFIRLLSVVEDLRHFLQHYDREIPMMDKNNSPIAGHLCWIEVKSSNVVEVILIQPGRIKTGTLRCINPVDKPIHGPIDHITFFLGKCSLDISDLVRGLGDFIQGIEAYLQAEYSKRPES